MKITHVVHSLDPVLGGLPAVPLRLATAQARLGHCISLLTSDDSHSFQYFLDAHGVSDAQAIRHLSAPRLSRWRRLSGQVATGALGHLFRGAEIVHLHGVWDSLLVQAAGASRRMGIPYVIAPHGMVDPWSLSQKAWKKRVALALRYRGLLSGAEFVHALNEAEAQFVRDLKVVSPARIIPNGVFLEEIYAASQSGENFLFNRFGWPGKNTLLFLGRLHWKKGLDILADAFALLASRNPAARLVVAGPDDGQLQPFQRQIESLGIADRVALPGPIYGADKYAALRDAAFFVLPSRQEGFSIAILEAMACGTPVVISEACHFPEVAKNDAGEVLDLNPHNHAEVYAQLLNDPERRARLGAAARELVSTNYTWDSIAKQSVALYQEGNAAYAGGSNLGTA